MFNQQTRTMYDKNEKIIKNVVSEKPLRWVQNQNSTYKSYRNGDMRNVEEETELRQQPTRLNYFNRQNRYTAPSPYDSLNMKQIGSESKLLHSLDSKQRERYETDKSVRSDLKNWDPNVYKWKPQVTPASLTLGGESSRNGYRNIYVCPK